MPDLTTRERIAAEYQHDESGRITSPGKFQGESLWAVHFYDAWLNGDGVDDGDVIRFDLMPADWDSFPELRGASGVEMFISDDGFVTATAHKANGDRI